MASKISLIFMAFLIASCSGGALTKNMLKEGESSISGGNFGEESWSDVLKFKRVSWYRDFNLLFDSHMWKVSETSKFVKWLSVKEKSYLKSCKSLYVVLNYNLDSDIISSNDFIKQLESQGAEYIELPQFKSNIKMHPHFEENSFNSYRVGGLCSQNSADLSIVFPGYGPIKIN